MKKFTFFILLSLLFGCGVHNMRLSQREFRCPISQNFFTDGSFEIPQETVESYYQSWIFEKDEDDIVNIDSTRAVDGNNCLRIVQPKNEVFIFSDSFPVYYRNFYGFKFSAKSVLKPLSISVNFITYDKDNKIIDHYDTKVKLKNGWNDYSLVADFLTPNAAFGRLYFLIPKTKSVVLLDHIQGYIVSNACKI